MPEQVLRRLAAGDPELLAWLGDAERSGRALPGLDDRVDSLLRLAALVALDAPQSSYAVAVSEAGRNGAGEADLVALLGAIATTVGSARVIAAAPRIGTALGYELEPGGTGPDASPGTR